MSWYHRRYHYISIHAPTRGATLQSTYIPCVGRYFNPRSHEGSDGYPRSYSFGRGISIHAPTRGATYGQSRHMDQLTVFQSTLPRGERLYHKHDNLYLLHFNPRSHEGSDSFLLICLFVTSISIHAPTRGATI